MRNYTPSAPFNVAMRLLIPTTTKSHGTTVKSYEVQNSPLIYGSFRTFGGTETRENEILTVLDTARVETWYRPDIKADCRLLVCETGDVYEIIGTPEDINMRHQYLSFKVEKVGGRP